MGKAALCFTFLFCALALSAHAEDRFGRPVIKLADPTSYSFFKLDDNQFPNLSKGDITVSCMTYRGTKRYYVEVGVVNQSATEIALRADFVSFSKPGYSVYVGDTMASAVDVWSSVAGSFIPAQPPPPTTATTTYSGSATSVGNTTQASGNATTTVDNSAAGWTALGNAIGARRYANAQNGEQKFATYLVSFAHEKQSLVVAPGKGALYVFTFEQIKQKKAPFTITVKVGEESFDFKYKE